MKSGAETIKAAMEAMASVKKMQIDPKTGKVLSRDNKSILEDIYDQSNQEIPVAIKKIVENKKEVLEKSARPVKDTVAAYYAMINNVDKSIILAEENKVLEPIQKLTVQPLVNEDVYMATLVAQIKKKR